MTDELQPVTARAMDLARQFEASALAQHDASEKGQYSRFGRLLKTMQDVRDELLSIPGEAYRALLPLLQSKNDHVKLRAAQTLAPIGISVARDTLQQLADDKTGPYCIDASFSLRHLDGEELP